VCGGICDIRRHDQDGDTTFGQSCLTGGNGFTPGLLGRDNHLAEHAAAPEHIAEVDFLDRFEPDILADNLRCDQDDRRAVAVGFVETVDEVQTAGTAASSAGRQAAGEQRFSLSGESACLLVPHVDPVDLAAIDRVRDPVQRVADDPIASPHTRSFQRFDQ
jgi:hypothetical protein